MNLTNAPFHQIRIPGIVPVSELGKSDIRRPQSVGSAATAPQMPVTIERTVPSIEQLLAQAEQLARTDTSLSKEQHFTRLLNENPGAYDEYEGSRAAKKVV
jgi:hypothetical protein